MISRTRIPSFIVAAFAGALAAGSCGRDANAPADDDAMHITLTNSDLILAAGSSGSVPVTIVRNAFAGIITLRTEGVPSGVTVPDVVVNGNEDQATLVFTATAGAAPGVSDISIRAEADSVETSIRILHLQIRPPGSFSIMCDPISLLPSATASTTLTVNRIGGFTGTVTLVLSAPTGITASLQPSELSGNSSTSLITIATASTVRPGAYFLHVTASSPGFSDETFDITVTVTGT